MAFNLVTFIIQLILSIIIIAPVLWLAGRALVGKEKAKFTDAIWIIVIGTVIGAIMGAFSLGIIGFIIQLIIWLYLVKRFFDCGWLKALVISIVAIIIFVVIVIALGLLLGLALFSFFL